MIAVWLGLLSATLLGLSDFVNALVTKRSSPWAVATLACTGAGAVALLAAPIFGGRLSGLDLLWACVAGVGSGVGTVYLYRGLAAGRMGVVAPVSAIGSALIPICFGWLAGERPGLLVWVAVVIGLPGIWLVAKAPSPAATSSQRGIDVRNGLAAGAGFGLLFGGLGQVSPDGSYWALVLCEVIAVAVLIAAAYFVGARWLPRGRGDWVGFAGGIIAGIGTLSFMLASQTSLLTIAAVLASLYPAVTIVLAVALLREHVSRPQALGLALCAATVALLTVA